MSISRRSLFALTAASAALPVVVAAAPAPEIGLSVAKHAALLSVPPQVLRPMTATELRELHCTAGFRYITSGPEWAQREEERLMLLSPLWERT